MSDAERLVHLQALIVGVPAQMIGSLDAMDNNYQLALELLKSTYDKPDAVITEIQHEIDISLPNRNTRVCPKSLILNCWYHWKEETLEHRLMLEKIFYVTTLTKKACVK